MKSTRNLLVPLIILIILVVGTIVYFVVDNTKHGNPDNTTAQYVEVVSVSPSDIDTISVRDNEKGFNAAVKCSTGSDGLIIYEYCGDDVDQNDSYSQDKLLNFVNMYHSYFSNMKVSDSGNFAAYGLDSPNFTVTINANDGSVICIQIGDKTPDGKNCYFNVLGTSDVYLIDVSRFDEACKCKVDFYEPMNITIDYADMSSVVFNRNSDGVKLEASVSLDRDGNAVYNIEKPYSHPSSNYFSNMIDSISHLEINYFVVVDDSNISSYGLKEPEYKFIFNMNDGSKNEIYISSLRDGYYYGYQKGVDKYFKIDDYCLEGFDLLETYYFDPNVYNIDSSTVSSVVCTHGDDSFEFELNLPTGKTIYSSDVEPKLNQRKATVTDSKNRSYAAVLYESINGIVIGGVELSAEVDTAVAPEYSILFNTKDYSTMQYDFYVRNSDTYYVFFNGKYTGFYVYSKELYYDAGADTYSYGVWSAYELLVEAIDGCGVNGVYEL